MNLRFDKRLRIWQRKFQRFLSRKISNRLMITYVLLGVLPLLIVSLILISLTRNTVQTYIYDRNIETARRAANEINLFIKEPVIILHNTALSWDITEMDRFAQSNLINKMKDENPIFRSIYVLNDSGYVTVTTRFGEEMKDFNETPEYQEAMKGNEVFSEVYFTQSRFPLMTISEPIKKYNQVAGVLVAEIDLKNIWNLVDQITIGESGIAFLLSEKGLVIAHKDKEKVLDRKNYSSYPFFRELTSEAEGIATYNIDEEDYILVYVKIPQLNWGVVVQQLQSEAFSLARQMQIRVLVFTAITILVALGLGVLGVKRLTKPLVKLVQGVREYASGNLQHKIDMKTHDELGELAQEFNSMAHSLLVNQQELQKMERLEALSRFAALVSHEIRNPLNSMNINMQILRRLIDRKEVSPERRIKYLEVISSEISRINDLVTNFLTIARPPELNLIRTDIHQILQDVILIQTARAASQGINIRHRFTSDSISGMFDYNQLKQVFHNIIINAFEAMEEGGTLFINTSIINKENSARELKYYVRMEFKDTGVGIPREILRDVFEFYHTTKRAGSGLGLAIAKQIVEGHKGIVYIDSMPKVGTSVFIELPIDEPPKPG
jgi:signal transduction histidine kinase